MRKILFILLLLSSGLNAQTFTFQCICDYLTAADANCDICNTNIQSRLFKGILIRKDGTAFKWIDQPYIVQFQGNNATFKELIPNGETITITLAGTPFDSIPQYQDSIKCPCAGSENFFVAGPGIYFSGDTISAVDTSFTNELQYVDSLYVSGDSLYISLYLDSIPAIGVPLPTGSVSISAGTGISVTGTGTLIDPYLITNTSPHVGTDLSYTGTSSPITLNSSTGADVTITAGTGISLAGTSSDLTISGTAAGLSKWTDGGATTYLTATGDNVAIGGTSATQKLDVTGSIQGSADLYLGSAFKIYDNGTRIYHRTASTNYFLGIGAGNTTLSGDGNNGFGRRTLLSLTSGSGNVGFGDQSLRAVTTGNSNVGLGTDAGLLLTTGNFNMLLGRNAGQSLTTGSENVAIGFNSLGSTTTTNSNTAIGYQALASNNPSSSVGIGINAGQGTTNRSLAVYIGGYAGHNSTATRQISMGYFAGSGSSANNSLFLGYAAGYSNTISNVFAIDWNSGFASDKTPLLGGSFSSTRVGVNTSLSSLAQTFNVTGTARITGSDGTATTVMGRDGDGDISALSLSGMSISAGTLTATDASATNEAQTLSVSGTTSGILSLNAISGVGGGTATIAAGTGITVGQSGGTITITNSSPASGGWLLDGNTIGATKTIGSNDNFDVGIESNGITRIVVDNAGTVTIGPTPLTTAQLSVNTLGSTNIGMLISGGSSLVGPTFYSATGSGSGSTATVFSGVISMVSGNVEALVKNTSSTGSGGALITLNSHQSSTGDPKTYYTTNGTTDWTAGIDNSVSGDPFKITANSDLGGATPAISSTTANKVGVNEAAAVVTLQVTGTDAIGLPTGTTAQRSAAAIPQIRHNNTFSGFEFYDQNKNYWYRLTAVSTPSATSNTAAGTGHSGSILSGSLSSDVRGTLELNTGTSTTTGTVMTVTYASAYSGTKTVVTLTPANDQAATDIAKWRIDTQSQTGFTIRAVSPLTASSTYTFNYYVGQ